MILLILFFRFLGEGPEFDSGPLFDIVQFSLVWVTLSDASYRHLMDSRQFCQFIEVRNESPALLEGYSQSTLFLSLLSWKPAIEETGLCLN